MRRGQEMGFALRDYHEQTKHSASSLAQSAHRLDWSNKPLPYKIYSSLESIPLPDDLARLCRYSNGVLRWRLGPSGERYGFRAAPCTGALYHVEIYLATAERSDLAAGLYHYGAHDDRLRALRWGDLRGALLKAGGGFASLASAPLILVLTSTFWRNAWKYRERAYRHAFWDSGVILANLLALRSETAGSASIVMGFVDDDVNRLVGADGTREAAVALVAIGSGAPSSRETPAFDELALPTEPLSPREVRYRAIEEAHRASSLTSADEVVAWRARAGAISDTPAAPLASLPIEEVISRRRSARRFSYGNIAREQLERAIAVASARCPGDAFGADLVEPFVIVNAVERLARGTYGPGLTPIRQGDFRRAAGELALGQELGASAAADVYFLSDLDAVLERFGDRGYRVAQIAGGIAGGRLELAATAMGLGTTGLTFFDNEVTRFFEPAAAGRQVMYLAAIGERAGRGVQGG
ncbi:MAG: SagB/ThcOx family dehydrogenase [Chloroflexi bacterium]|nr:MAG: SagB/ThcOx family dehydrogenase [Chloroflexota bacterium]